MILSDVFPVPVEWLDSVDMQMADTVAAWAERDVSAKRLEHGEDRDDLLGPATRSLFIDIGLQSMMVPERLGGGGMDSPESAMTACAALEAAGTADTGIGFTAANSLAFLSSIALEPGRDEALLERLSSFFTGGEPVIAALVLPSYSDSLGAGRGLWGGLSYQVAATRDDDGFVLSGKDVRPQCCGASATFFATAFDSGKGPALGIVSREAAGLKIGGEFLKTGLAASDNAELAIDSVAVPSDDVVCAGPEKFLAVLNRYYLFCAAVTSGALLATYGILKEWGDTRVIKGKGQVFKENPLVASIMGEVGANIARTRLLTYHLARMLSRPDVYGPAGAPAMHATSTAVFKGATAAAMRAMDATMELMGSAGYATEWNLERYWRDVKTMEAVVVPETAALVDMARHYFGLKTV